MATTPDYTVNLEDERLTSVTDEMNDTLDNNKNLYGGMIGSTDQYFDKQIQATQDWADKQTQLQNERTDFTIEQIEQQKDQANKDYIKEQSGAYVDWQKQSNKYGVEAEKMASSGLTGTGYSESSQVSMYNTYQNRVATARESYNQAILNYNNAIKDAQLQNNAALAEIAYNALQQQLELSLQGFQYKNQLILEQANKELEIKNMYHSQWMDMLNQINTENALAEDIRQYNETMKWNTEQAELDRQFKATQAELDREHDVKLKEIQHNYDVKMAEIEQNYKIAYLNAQTAKEKELLKIQHDNDIAKLNKQLENDIAKLNKQLENEKALLKYEYSLKQTYSTPLTGNKSSGYTGKAITSNNGKVTEKDVSNIPINANSKKSLGQGPISDATAAERVNNGTATAIMKDGQVYVTPNVMLPTTKLSLNQSTRKYNKAANKG